MDYIPQPGAPFRMIRIETTDIRPGLRNGGPGQEQPYESGTFIKEVHVYVMPLLGLVQGHTAALAEEDTYALFLGDPGKACPRVKILAGRPARKREKVQFLDKHPVKYVQLQPV